MAKIALLSFLDEHNLASTEPALRDLGAESVDDLRDLDDSDIERLGLKKLELKRFTRAVQELRAQADEAAVRAGLAPRYRANVYPLLEKDFASLGERQWLVGR